MIDRTELVREVADHLFYQLQLVGPTPTKFERMKDAVDMAAEVGETVPPEQAAVYSSMSRDDSTPGPRPSATLELCVIPHIEYLRDLRVPMYREWNDYPHHNTCFDIVAEAMKLAKEELREQGKIAPLHRLPTSYETIRKIWEHA